MIRVFLQMMTNKFKKLFEDDMLIIPWDNIKT